MILASTADLKKYIAIGESFIFEDFEPYILKAVNKFTKKYVGNLHLALQDIPTGTDADIKQQAREQLRNALANFAWFLYLPLAQLQIDSSGISISVNENKKAAEWWQIKDLRRECLQSGHDAMDELLAILEANPTIFPVYSVNFSSINHELVVSNAVTFSKYYNINNSRLIYLALQHSIRTVEDQFLRPFMSNELLSTIKSPCTGKVNDFKTEIKKAVVAFTVAKIANIGLFILDDKGLRIDFENFMDGNRSNPTSGNTSEQLERLAIELMNNGTNYLSVATEIVKSNPTDFAFFSDPLNERKVQQGRLFTHNTKGVLGL
ncbi:DUF6712 family protein [Flavobacterium columnare]|uniref:Uncharacterized protein n=1 Tax=Flavobacterium columnare (strain ATCC 49512 / CIP 103533 / TG 44/87) TaxID=1041826 RepID=G8X9E8_FLACA|nr:DUF6712 family protein [Flavobacterium columnare]AEW85895.1 hypothetical protein FCOL_05350 [Flavobacterium columnare ATCC 49512]